jgi:uncharacterized protein (TIRG00374 family)
MVDHRQTPDRTAALAESPAPEAAPGIPPVEPARTRRRGLVSRIVVLVIIGVALWYGMAKIDWPSLWRAIAAANIAWGVAAVAVAVLAHLARAQRWRLLIPDGERIGLHAAFSATIVGYMFNNIVPRSGELVRPWLIARRESRPLSTMIASIVVERIIDGLSLLLIVVALALSSRDLLERLIPGRTAEGLVAAIVLPIGALVVAIVLAVRTSLGDRLVAALARRLPERHAARAHAMLADFRAGVSFGGSGGAVAVALYSIVIWLGYFLGIYFAFFAFGFDATYGLGVKEALVTLGITSIGITIAPTPGGFFVYHSFCIAVLWVFGVPRDQAAAYALAAHGAPYIVVTALGAVYALLQDVSIGSVLRGNRNLPSPIPSSTDAESDRGSLRS